MIQLMNDSLTARYNTLIRNIKSKSNSYYDSYLDLLEATIKYILDEKNIEYDETRTCGNIIKNESIKSFLLSEMMLDDITYNKLPDYIKKCNDHKHKKEKCLSIDSVVNYLKVYFDLINCYFRYQNRDEFNFDLEYFTSIFGETERLNNEYKKEVARLKEELNESLMNNKLSNEDIKIYQSLLSIRELELMNLDDQNQKLQEQISLLKDIKLNSLEEKLNKALEMLVNLNSEILENRVGMDAVYRSICGENIQSAIKRIKEQNKN